MGRLKLLGEHNGAGAAAVDILEGDSTIVATASKLSFGASDFDVSHAGSGRANVAIDYANSGICRKGQNEDVTGLWQFSNTGTLNMAGLLDVAKAIAVGSAATATASRLIYADESTDACAQLFAAYLYATSSYGGPGVTVGLYGRARYEGASEYNGVRALDFTAQSAGAGATMPELIGIRVYLSYVDAPPNNAYGIYVGAGGAGSKPPTAYGILIPNMKATTNAYGLKIADQDGTNKYLVEVGPSTPNLRVLGGTPPVGKTNLLASVGGTLKRLIVDANDFVKVEAV